MMMEIADLKVRQGEKTAGYLPVAPRGDGTYVRLPLFAVNGVHEGPTFVVSGGVHGDEFEGPEAIRRIWRKLDPGQLRGAFVGVPVVNVTAVEAAARKSPIDGFDMNRIFPGHEDGYISERIAHFFFHEMVVKADGYLDLHAAGNAFAIAPMAIYLDTGDDEFKAKELAFAKAAGVDMLWKGRGLWAAAHVAGIKRGIPGITVELGQEGRCSEPLVALGEQVVLNLMKHLGMVDGAPQLPKSWTVIKGTYLHSQAGGTFHPEAGVREAVKRGDTVGVITDLLGEVVETVEAPCDGIICSTRTFPAIRPGEWTVFVGELVETLQ
jgi:predicted deacylase